MLVVFILNQPCRILSGNPTKNCYKSENFDESGFQMWAIIRSLQISTQSCPKIRLCGWMKASHWTLVLHVTLGFKKSSKFVTVFVYVALGCRFSDINA